MSVALEHAVVGEEPVDINRLIGMQDEAKTYAAELGLEVEPLSENELNRFGWSFQRQFLPSWEMREIVDLWLRHQREILMGAMVAKKQMESTIDGEQPGSGKIGGPLLTRACWLGVGDDWEDILGIYAAAQGAWTTGTPQNWIHSGTSLLAGTAGNAVKILENAVHVIIGYGSAHASPKIESLQFTIDGKEKPILLLFQPVKNSPYSLRWKEFDNAILLKRGTTIKGKVFISNAFGAGSALQTDYPYLYSASFIMEAQLRLHDPVNVPGTVQGVITTT